MFGVFSAVVFRVRFARGRPPALVVLSALSFDVVVDADMHEEAVCRFGVRRGSPSGGKLGACCMATSFPAPSRVFGGMLVAAWDKFSVVVLHAPCAPWRNTSLN